MKLIVLELSEVDTKKRRSERWKRKILIGQTWDLDI